MPGKTLALIGGNIALEGGNLTAPGGRVELGSVSDGTVSIKPTTSGWVFGYQDLQSFQNITMSKQALVDTSGFGNSAIQLVGKQISFTEGSVALIQNQGAQAGSGINIQASNLLQLNGTSPDGTIPSGVEVETLGGNAGDVVVSTKYLSFENGGAINSKTFTEANASNILLNASESIEVKGFSFINPTTASIASGVGSYTFSTGTSGKIVINTSQFTALDGGIITSGTFSAGTGGDLIISADRSVELSGFNPILSSPTQASVVAYGSGNSGDLKITSPQVRLYNRGIIASYTFSSGNSGKVTIEASNFVDITTPTNIEALSYNFMSGIGSYAVSPPPSIQQVLGLSSEISGASGSIKIKTGQFSLSKGSITVSNLGTGSAGNIDIDANIVSLKNNSSISAATALADGGNIFISANYVQLLDSIISASASNPQAAYHLLGIEFPYSLAPTGTGKGGNININTTLLTGLRNSSIKANAFEGRGGNIRINARGLFFSPDSFITATSQLGVDGTVENNSFYYYPIDLEPVPVIVTETPKIVSGCAAQSGTESNILIVASNSPPPKFDEHLDSQPIWQRNSISSKPDELSSKLQLATIKETTEIVEAQSWVIDSRGNVELVAIAPNQATPDSFFSTIPCTSVDSIAEFSHPSNIVKR